MQNLRGRRRNERDGQTEKRNRAEKDDREVEADTDFDFNQTKEVGVHRLEEKAETGRKGSHRTESPSQSQSKKGEGKPKRVRHGHGPIS